MTCELIGKAAQVTSRPSIQRQRVTCGQQWISSVIFESVGKHSWLFFQYRSLLRGVLGHYPQHMCMLRTCKVRLHTQDLRTVSSSALMASTFLFCPNRTWETVKRTTRKGQSADGMSADLLELSPKQVPTHECGRWG